MEKRRRVPILIDDKFTEQEMSVIYDFCDNGNRRYSYRKHISGKYSDAEVYRWFKRKDVIDKIIEVGQDLSIYDTVADKTLLSIISNPDAIDRDKISAIKVWNDLRKRVHQTLKIESATSIDFTTVSDANLEAVVNKILQIEEDARSN